ncbi:MAG TPA: type II toxin-antitoxin system RelE/ParE family toxin [bacterium]
MGSYDVVLKPSVERDLRSLSKATVAKVMRQIETLRDNPFPHQSVKLSGVEQFYRIRIGNYRLIYGVDKREPNRLLFIMSVIEKTFIAICNRTYLTPDL